ncbi:MAG: hypothetical protein RLZZ292_3755 [Bacteroidota bacterium]
MVIERTSTEVILRLPNNIAWEDLQLMLNFLRYREKVATSKATQDDIDTISSEMNKNWWSENKHRFLQG